MKQNELLSIDALLSIENEDLLQMDGFGWRMMKEVLSLRKVHQLNDIGANGSYCSYFNIMKF